MVKDVRWIRRELFKRPGSPYYWGHVRDTRKEKVHRFSTKRTAKSRAREYVESWIREKEAKERYLEKSEAPAFSVAFGEWLELKTCRPVTLNGYRMDFDRIYTPEFGDNLVNEIESEDVERFLSRLAKDERSSRTRAKHLTQLRSFFTWCRFPRKYLTQNPTEGLKVQRGDKRSGTALDEDECRRLLEVAQEPVVIKVKDHKGARKGKTWKRTANPPDHLHLAVALAIYTGLRRRNVTELTWDDVDLKKRQISLEAKRMKGKRDFEVPIHPALVRLLKAELKKLGHVDQEARVLGVDVTEIRTSFKRALKLAKLKDTVRWHDLRHTYGTLLATRTTHAVRQALMGHAARDVTDIYTHVDWKSKVEAIDSLPDLMEKAGEPRKTQKA